MEKKIELKIRFIDETLTVTLGVWRVIYENGIEIARSEPFICVLEKNTDLTVPLQTSFGEVLLADYPAERDYIAAKWA